LRFNVKKDDILYFTSDSPSPFFDDRASFDVNRLNVVDAIPLDKHSRLTITKKVKNVFPIVAGDIIVIYQDKYNSKELLFKIQRGSDIVDNWIVKRKDVDGIDKNPSQASKVNAKKKITCYDDYNTNYLTKNDNEEIPNIILVDDEPDILYIFKTILSDEGYNVKSFNESKEALKHILELDYSSYSSSYNNTTTYSSHPPHYDLAIIDIRMPHINGIQLYQILKIINKNIKVLFISALDAAEEIISMFPEVKPSSIIRKPVSQEYFIEKVQETISSTTN
jgi:CheY-like chemotaxis protein